MMRYYGVRSIGTEVEAESPEVAAREFARLLEDGDLGLSDVVDRDEDDEAAAQLDVSETTPDGRRITYYVAVVDRLASVRRVTENRPFRFPDEEER